MCIMCLMPSMWKFWLDEMAKLEPRLRDPVLSSAYPVHESASEVNCSGADRQVVSCHCSLVIFHSFVEQLTVFHISGLILASSSVLQVLNLDLHHDGIMSGMCHKLCVNSIINRYGQTCIHTSTTSD